MTKPSYEELRITKHSGSPQIADSARGGKRAKAAKETREVLVPLAALKNMALQYLSCPACLAEDGEAHGIRCWFNAAIKKGEQ